MSVQILVGDALAVLSDLPDQSVQCCVTSPPYWGLRDYGTAKWVGGDAACDHKHGGQVPQTKHLAAAENFATGQRPGTDNSHCSKCGARRIDAQLGLEPTPAEYVEKMVAVFREVRRVLRDDGTLWLNLGDSYNSIGHKKSSSGYGSTGLAGGIAQEHTPLRRENTDPSLKHKDLCGIPWRVAFALQADGCADWKAVQTIDRVRDEIIEAYAGELIPDKVLVTLERLGAEYAHAKGASWYLRQDIIWNKPNPMPESVRDRCTKSHEYLFLLAKSEKYYFDADAIKEPSITSDTRKPYAPGQVDARGNGHARGGGEQRKLGEKISHADSSSVRAVAGARMGRGAGWRDDPANYFMTRNKRSVWTVSTQPYAEAHFATFPPKLIEPCILAGCPAGGVVLDPFGGAGTTGLVANQHGRDAVLIELNPEYVAMAARRIRGDSPLFAEVT